MVEQHGRYPGHAEQRLSHHREQHRRGEHHSHQHATGQIDDLGTALFGFHIAACRFGGGRLGLAARHRSGLRGHITGRGTIPWVDHPWVDHPWVDHPGIDHPGIDHPGIDHQRAVDHVHPAREPERAGLGGHQPERGPPVRGQFRAEPQIGKHHPGGAVSRLPAVEHHLHRHAPTYPDDIWPVPAAHDHLHSLHPVDEASGAGPARPEEEPAQHGDGHAGDDHDDDVNRAHAGLRGSGGPSRRPRAESRMLTEKQIRTVTTPNGNAGESLPIVASGFALDTRWGRDFGRSLRAHRGACGGRVRSDA